MNIERVLDSLRRDSVLMMASDHIWCGDHILYGDRNAVLSLLEDMMKVSKGWSCPFLFFFLFFYFFRLFC
jgi:hypothetical protein